MKYEYCGKEYHEGYFNRFCYKLCASGHLSSFTNHNNIKLWYCKKCSKEIKSYGIQILIEDYKEIDINKL